MQSNLETLVGDVNVDANIDPSTVVEVEQLIRAYWNRLDRRDYPGVLALLTEDVDWRTTSEQQGKANVARALDGRPDFFVRHLAQNLSVAPAGDGYDVFFVVTAYAHFPGPGAAPPYPAAPPGIIADVDAHVTRTPAGLRISRLNATIIFRAGGEPKN